MRLYQNKKTGKLLLALHWNGNNPIDITGDDEHWDSGDIDENTNLGVYVPSSKNISIDLYDNNMDLYDDDSIVNHIHPNDYIYRTYYNDYDNHPMFAVMNPKKFEVNYKPYKIIQPSFNHVYVIEHDTGEYSDTEFSLVMATGSAKQASTITKFFNSYATAIGEHFEYWHLDTDGHANMLFPM